MNERKKLKISLKVVIPIIIFIIALVVLIIYTIYVMINKNSPKIVDDKDTYYGKTCNMTSSNKLKITMRIPECYIFNQDDMSICSSDYNMSISVLNSEYNYENFSLDYYKDRFIKDFSETIYETNNLTNNNLEIYYIAYKREGIYVEQNAIEDNILAYYIVKNDNMFINIFVVYNNLETYNKNKDIVNTIVSNMEIEDNSPIEEYINIANQDSSYVRNVKEYNNLTDVQKEIYNMLYEKVFKKRETYSAKNIENDDYYNAFWALNVDVCGEDPENYNIAMETTEEIEGVSSNYYFYPQKDAYVFMPYRQLTKYGIYDYLYIPCDWLDEKQEITLIEEEYLMSDDEREIFDKNVNDIIEKMPENLSTYGKYKYLSDSICDLVEYDHETLAWEEETLEYNPRIHNLVGVFVDRKAVCDGYAEAYWYLCNKVGLYCGFLAAKGEDDDAHAYNYIMLGGRYYFVDVTWLDETGDGQEFAFIYDQNKENQHNVYVENLLETMEKDKNFQDFIKKLGTMDWYGEKIVY